MPRRIITRVDLPHPSVDVDADARKLKLLEISGWQEKEIDDVISSLKDSKQPGMLETFQKGTPNVAFFALILDKIDASDTLHRQYDMPRIIDLFDLRIPNKLASFTRLIKRHVGKAFNKQQYADLTGIPGPLQTQTVGRLCNDAGLSEDWLLNSNEVYQGTLDITIGHILELIKFAGVRGLSNEQCSVLVQRLFNLKQVHHSGTIRRQWERIQTRASDLRRKGKKEELQSYLKLVYVPPSPSDSNSLNAAPAKENQASLTLVVDVKQLADKSTQCEKTFPSLADLAMFSFRKSLAGVNTTHSMNEIRKIDVQLQLGKSQLAGLQVKVASATEKLNKICHRVGHYNTKNVYKRDQRALAAREKLAGCEAVIKSLTEKVASLEKEKNNALKDKSRWKAKAKSAEVCNQCPTKDKKISELSSTLQGLEVEKDCLIETLSDKATPESQKQSMISTQEVRDGHKGYSDKLRLVYMEILSLGVPVAKCSHVVETVLKGLTDLDIEKLPSKATVSGFQSECETVSQMHVADVILENKDLTLSLDGTKKKFREYGSFQVSHSKTDSIGNAKKSLSVGLQEMCKGDTECFLNTMSLVFKDLAETFSDDSDRISELHAQMIANVKNLMTDRHVVNKTFKDKFETFRRDIFSKHLKDFESMSEDKQDQLVQIHGMFCGLHVIANLGTAAEKGLKVYEEISLPPSVKISEYSFNKGNSRTFDLIFEISQSLTVSGSQRFGRLAEWDAFLAGLNEKNEILSFLRHRFNVIFADGAAIFYHLDHIKQFLATLGSTNRLLRCIGDSIESPVCQAGLRALGMVAMLITQPLWRVIERDNVHIFDLNEQWHHLEDSLQRLSLDASDLLNGHSVFPDFECQKGKLYDELFKPVSLEVASLTKECLELICHHMHSLVKRQVQDQLPGGKYAEPSAEVRAETKSCPTSNRAGEKDFSDLDREVNRAPQRLTSHISGTVCFRNNKTWQYFRSLPAKRRSQLMVRAMQLAPIRRRRNHERQRAVRDARRKMLEAAKAIKEAKIEKALLGKAALNARIREAGGVWETTEDVRRRVSLIKTKGGKVKALKDQIRHHQNRVLLNKEQKYLVQFSSEKVQFSVEKLQENLERLLNLSDKPTPVESNSVQLRPHDQRQELISKHVKPLPVPVPVPVPVPSGTTVIGSSVATSASTSGIGTSRTQIQGRTGTSCSRKVAKSIVKKALAAKRANNSCPTTGVPEKRPRLAPTLMQEKKKFLFTETTKGSFVAVAFNTGWYLGEVKTVLSSDLADISFMKWVGSKYFQWPVQPEEEQTKSIYVIKDHLTIVPRDSGLRIWMCSEPVADIEGIYQTYKAEYF